MSDVTLGDEWREVSLDRWRENPPPPLADQAYVRVAGEEHYYHRRPALPDLPLEDDTVIAVTWNDDVSANDDRLMRHLGGWCNFDGVIWTEADLRRHISAFEVKSRPVGQVLAEDRDEYFDADDLATERRKGWNEGGQASVIDVIAKVRGIHLGCQDASINLEAGLRQIERSAGLRPADEQDGRVYPHTS